MGVPTLLMLLEPNVVWRHAAASHVSGSVPCNVMGCNVLYYMTTAGAVARSLHVVTAAGHDCGSALLVRAVRQ
jgi:hypothetical protein